MTYLSNTAEDRAEMLAAIGIASFDDLLEPLPPAIRLGRDLNLPPQLDEAALVRHLQSLAARNVNAESHTCYLGAGAYDHFRPAVVPHLQGRGEFATSYTPYQPEMSQGMLQAIYEYQTLICALTGMDLSNASMYDAATGLAEAALMAIAVLDRTQVVVPTSIHPHYRQVITTYFQATGYEFVEVDYRQGIEGIKSAIGPNTAAVLMQHPDFFGSLTDVAALTELAHSVGALSIVSVDPVSLGLLTPPGALDVDIVVGEGQSLGNPMGFGGPLLGFFACKKKFIRAFPGRIVGATVDQQGRRGYTMTLRTREQDIRREKATSNICTNQALLALAATIYMCEMGKSGLRQVADLSLQKAHYCREQLARIPGVTVLFEDKPFFKEFAVCLPVAPEAVNAELLKRGILGGLPLGPHYTELPDAVLIAVTETKTKDDIDALVSAVSEICAHAS